MMVREDFSKERRHFKVRKKKKHKNTLAIPREKITAFQGKETAC